MRRRRAMIDILDRPGAGAAAVRGALVRIAGYVAGLAVSVVGATLLFRHLGVVDAGRYVFIVSVAAISSGITDGGLTLLGVRELTQRSVDRPPEVVSDLLGMRLALAAVAVVVSCAYVALAGHGVSLVMGCIVVGAALLVQGIGSIVTVALHAGLRLAWLALADLVRQVVSTAGIVVLVAAGARLPAFFVMLIVASLAGAAAGVAVLRGKVPRRPTFDRVRWRKLAVITLPFALTTAVGVLYFRIGILIVDRFAGDAATGHYGLSFRAVEVLTNVPLLGVGALFPVLARTALRDRDRLRAALQRTLDLTFGAGLVVTVVLASAAPVAVRLIGGDEYAPAASVLRWHALALGGVFTAAPFVYTLLAVDNVRAVLRMSLVALAVTVAVGVPLTAWAGAPGAAATTAAGQWVLAVAGAVEAAGAGLGVRLNTMAKLVAAASTGLLAALVLPAAAGPVAAAAVMGALVLLRALPIELLHRSAR